MIMTDQLLTALILVLLAACILLLWVYRRRLHSNASFTAETVFHNFQTDEGRAAIVQHQHDKEDCTREASGEKS